MKKKILNVLCIIILSFPVSAQKEYIIDTVLNTKYKTPFLNRFVNENIWLANKNFRWKSSFYNVVNISMFSKPQNLYKTDFLTIGNQFINVNLLSFYTFDFPMKMKKSRRYSYLFYTTSLGLRFPVLSGRNYDCTFGFDYYWPINFRRENKDSIYYDTNTLLAGTNTIYKNSPQIIDFRLDLKVCAFKYAGISIFGGYRNQFTKWYGTDRGRVIYSNNISGGYFGVSLSYNVYIRTNNGLNKWEKSRSDNTPNAYTSFLSEFPDNHYENEAVKRKEDAYYLAAVKGKVADCNIYLNEYPNGRYTNNVKQLLDNIETKFYKVAVTEGIVDCENYLQMYKNGKYVEDVKKLLTEKKDKIEATDYNKAINGSITDCDYYLEKHPNGKYGKEVIAEKENKIETGYYDSAINGGYAECDIYLKHYPQGKYRSEISGIRKIKFEKAEEESFKSVASGNYAECEKYRKSFPDGKHVKEVEILYLLMKYDINVIPRVIVLSNPGYDKIEILKNSYTGDLNFKYDVVVISQKGNIVYVNPVTSPSVPTEFVAAPYSDKMNDYSSFGKPDTRMDISVMKNGFVYNNKIWYPTSYKDAVIICVKDKIIGYNVRFVNSKH